MKGRIFQVDDIGHGGPGGYVHILTHLCVDGKVHVTHEKLHNEGDNHVGFGDSVVPCDGSCGKTMYLSPELEEKVRKIM